MSLNRCEQTLFDYINRHRDERQFWENKVRKFVTESGDIPTSVSRIDYDLWRYCVERNEVIAALRATLDLPPGHRVSMKTLAELMIRLWTEPRKRVRAESESGKPEL